jgi:hypothetical protein
MKVCFMLMDRRRACGKCGKAERFGEAFPSSCGNPHQKKLPKATDGFADFHSCGIFHRPFSFSFLVLFSFSFLNEFPLWKTGRVALRIRHPTALTVGGDFRARSVREVERMLR